MKWMIPFFEPVSREEEDEILQRYNKTRESINQDVESLRAWLHAQPHLPHTLTYQQIRNYLLIGRGSVEKTKPKIDMYFTMKSLFPEIFLESNPSCERIISTLKYIYLLPLPRLTKDLNRILVLKLRDYDPTYMDPYAIFANLMNMVDIRLLEDLCDCHIVIVDMQHCKLGHVTKITPMLVKMMYTIGDKALTTRVIAIHIINAPLFVDQLVFLVKSIVKPKLANRIFVHKDMESVIEAIDKDILPADYGGNERSLEELQVALNKKYEEYKDYFDDRDMLRVNEELRPTKYVNDDILGYYGNFKKLDFD